MDDIMELKRSYQSVEVAQADPKIISKVFAKHGSQVRNLIVSHGKFETAKDFHEILSYLPLLEKLEILQSEFILSPSEVLAIEPVQLRRLQSLKLTYGSSWIALRYFTGCQPKTFEQYMMSKDQNEEASQSLLRFVKSLNSLEKLKCDETLIFNLFKYSESEKLMFRLKSLDVSYHSDQTNLEAIRRFRKFMEHQGPSLVELKFRKISSEFLETFYRHLKNLKKLTIEVSNPPNDKKFYERFTPFEKLEEIVCLSWPVGSEVAAQELLKLCPNLRSLKVERDTVISNLIPFMAKFNPKIEFLKLDRIKTAIGTEIGFKSLKTFYLTYRIDAEVLRNVLKSNQSIETFGLRLTSDGDIAQILVDLPDLKHLKVGGEVISMKQIFDRIVAKRNKIETLDIIFEKVPGRPQIQFKLPEDAYSWDIKCPFLKHYEKNAESEFGYRISVNHLTDFK